MGPTRPIGWDRVCFGSFVLSGAVVGGLAFESERSDIVGQGVWDIDRACSRGWINAIAACIRRGGAILENRYVLPLSSLCQNDIGSRRLDFRSGERIGALRRNSSSGCVRWRPWYGESWIRVLPFGCMWRGLAGGSGLIIGWQRSLFHL
jgi:hypothetical protein